LKKEYNYAIKSKLNTIEELVQIMKLNFKLILPFLYLILGLIPLNADLIRIMPLGDSITYDDRHSDHEGIKRPSSVRTGYRSHLHYQLADAGYPVDFVGSRVAGEAIVPAFDPHNEGHPGWESYEIADNVYRYLSINPADIILLHIGTNDYDVSVAGVNDILDEVDLYEELTGRFVRVIVALIIDKKDQDDIVMAGFNHNLNNLLQKRILNGDAISIVDMYRGAGMTSDDYADNTHPTDAGYQKIANVWFNALMEPYNVALHKFPYSLVPRSHIRSISVDETANQVVFITDVPNNGITF